MPSLVFLRSRLQNGILPTMSQDTNPKHGFATDAVHVGTTRNPGDPLGTPIYPVIAWEFENLEHAEYIFKTNDGRSYSRIQNPTTEVLEERLTALEGARGAIATTTGQAATLLTILTLAKAGDHIVATSSLFGGSAGLFNNVFPNMGITSTLVPNDVNAIAAAIKPNTRAVWVEIIGNPAMDVPDLSAIAAIARAANIPFIVDNTWGAVGYLCRPLEFGASISVHSLTKWASGQGAVMGGAVLVGNDLNLQNNAIFNTPDASGKSLLENFGENAFLTRARNLGLLSLGLTLAPQSAWTINAGLETLEVRVKRECETALELSRWLETQAGVAWVSYPGLTNHAWHVNASKYLRNGFGAVFTVGIDGGLEGTKRFYNNLKLIRKATNLGDVRTLAVHPWTTTHGRLNDAGRAAAGVTPEMIRVSVGLEDVNDLKRDFRQALDLVN
jgi:O-acetylhomoserine (thiol)-lyase